MEILFFKLLRFSLGLENTFSDVLSGYEWREVYKLCVKHSLTGIIFLGIERLSMEQMPPKALLFQWYGMTEKIKVLNNIQNKRCGELTRIFNNAGFRNCVLKGQGISLLYPKPQYRQCGDIDMWVEGNRDDIIDFVRGYGVNIKSIDVQHSEMDFFEDVPVEIHFRPSYSFNYFFSKRLETWTKSMEDSQFSNFDSSVGFTHPNIDFNLVFSLMHIYRHQFSAGIGLRQLIDYFYILKGSNATQRQKAYTCIGYFGMRKFTGAVMYVLKNVLNVGDSLLLCPANTRYGKFLLDEIMTAGNFGQYDKRINHIDKQKKFKRGIVQFKRNWRFVQYYPQEVLLSPFWKLWHWGWRKSKGYL